MTEHKYTDEEVIKALELCFAQKGTSYTCAKCPYHKFGTLCKVERDRDALDLINRQKAEIERLTVEKDNLIKTYKECMVEAIKEFAEKLKKDCLFDRGYEILQEGTIDHLVKEFMEEKK